MKTLLFTLEYPPQIGGVGNYYYNLVKNWPEPDNIFVLDNNFDKLIAKKLPILKWWPAIKNLHIEIQQKKIDYVLVGNILPLGMVTWLLAKFLKFNYGVILHGTDISYSQKSWRKKLLAKKILKDAAHIICNSQFTLELVKDFSQEVGGGCTVIYPGVSLQPASNSRLIGELKKKYNLENKIVLFSVSRLIKRKGMDKVIEAMPQILRELPNLVYFVAGGGPDEKYLNKLAEKNSLFCHCEEYSRLGIAGNSDAMVFLGKISDEEKWAWFELCDMFIQPAREEKGNLEGFGIVYLEANLAGKPVIAGKSGGVREAVIDQATGLLVDPEDISEIKEAIVKLAKDTDLKNKLGKQGRERVINDFQWSELIKDLYNFISTPKI